MTDDLQQSEMFVIVAQLDKRVGAKLQYNLYSESTMPEEEVITIIRNWLKRAEDECYAHFTQKSLNLVFTPLKPQPL